MTARTFGARGPARRPVLASALAIAAAALVAVPGLSAAPSRRAGRLPSVVVTCPRPADALPARLDWARAESRRDGAPNGFWAVYTIRRLQNPRSRIGTWSDDDAGLATLQEVLTGKPAPSPVEGRAAVRRTAKEILDEMNAGRGPEAKVWKDLAILLRFGAAGASLPRSVEISDLDLAVDLENVPLYWLGGASDADSLAVVKGIYDGASDDELRKHAVLAAGVHESAAATPFLKGVLQSGASPGVRKDAAFWLGQQDEASVLPLLTRTVRTDASAEVRKSALFALSQVNGPAALDELIALAKGAQDPETRKEAVFWLGQKASKKAGETLVGFAYDDKDSRVREQAVFALSQLPGGQGVDPLIKIARTHPDPRVRKKAIFWLGECRDPRAVETLVEIAKGK